MEKHITGIRASLQEFICDGTPQRICKRYNSLKNLAQTIDLGPFDSNIVVIDTEATGLSFAHDELTQIAAARIENGEIVARFTTFVNPGKPIPEDIVHLTHITQEDVANAPTPQQALSMLVDFVGDAVCVAHNVEFDRTFTTKHPEGYSLLEKTWIDTLELARIALPRLKSHRLLDLVRAFDAPLSTHRADADVEATCAILPLLFAGVASMPAPLVSCIANLVSPQQWNTQVVFDYFAKQNEEQARERNKTVPTFSLRKLRNQSLSSSVCKERPDAAELAKDPLVGIHPASQEEITAAFGSEGLIGSLYENYEQRPEQCTMAAAVNKAIEQSDNLVVEAGTGVGKSMAYLLPLALLAKRNNITVGVATKTNALLDQLVYHELPLLNKALGGITSVPLKGYAHYPCLQKIERVLAKKDYVRELGDKETTCAVPLAALLSYVEQSEYTDLDALKIDYRLLPRWSITSTSQECLKRKCPYYKSGCFVHGSRRAAAAADVVVTNHSLFFCDLSVEGGLLPPIRYWAIDEAHGAEQEARHAFSYELASGQVADIARKVSPESKQSVFERTQQQAQLIKKQSEKALLYGLTGAAISASQEFVQAAHDYIPCVKDLLFYDSQRNKSYEFTDIWINREIRNSSRFQGLAHKARTLSTRAENLISACQKLVAYLDNEEKLAPLQQEIAVLSLSLRSVVENCECIFLQPKDNFAYSVTLSHKKDHYVDKFEALPLHTGSILNNALYDTTHSVVYASATVAIGKSFDSFTSAVGLNQGESSRASTLLLGSSFDFDNHMTIYVPTDMPEPSQKGYLARLQRLLIATHRAQQGSMLTLFTNRREMTACYEVVSSELKKDNLRVVYQKRGASVKGLRDDFLSDTQLSLFALKSFWEGFDAPGSTLRGVIIPKLPFAKPSDPLSCERSTRDSQAWMHYVLPAAVIETKQAAGRLIRTKTDEGILILADARLLSKNYGKTFLDSMPTSNIRFLTCDEIALDIEKNQSR